MRVYKNLGKSQVKKWHIGVLSLASFTFVQPTPKVALRVKNRGEQRPQIPLKTKTAKKGIDLEKRHLEVKKIFMKHCAKMCLDNRCEPEDVLQEVYKGILIRNNGTCPFDSAKSAFSTYVVMVSRCVTINYINKIKKKTGGEVYGIENSIENEDYLIGGVTEDSIEEEMFISQLRGLLKKEQAEIYDDLLAGYKVSHISKRRKLDSRKVNKYIGEIRRILEPHVQKDNALC